MWAHCGTPNLESIIIILNKNSQHSDDLDSGAFPNHAMNGKRPAASLRTACAARVSQKKSFSVEDLIRL